MNKVMAASVQSCPAELIFVSLTERETTGMAGASQAGQVRPVGLRDTDRSRGWTPPFRPHRLDAEPSGAYRRAG